MPVGCDRRLHRDPDKPDAKLRIVQHRARYYYSWVSRAFFRLGGTAPRPRPAQVRVWLGRPSQPQAGCRIALGGRWWPGGRRGPARDTTAVEVALECKRRKSRERGSRTSRHGIRVSLLRSPQAARVHCGITPTGELVREETGGPRPRVPMTESVPAQGGAPFPEL